MALHSAGHGAPLFVCSADLREQGARCVGCEGDCRHGIMTGVAGASLRPFIFSFSGTAARERWLITPC